MKKKLFIKVVFDLLNDLETKDTYDKYQNFVDCLRAIYRNNNYKLRCDLDKYFAKD